MAADPTPAPASAGRSSVGGVRSPVFRLLCGLLAGLAAVALRVSLQPLMGDEVRFAIAFPTMVVAAVVWGTGAGAMATLAAAAGSLFAGLDPDLPVRGRWWPVIGFLAAGVALSWIIGRLAARRRPPAPPPEAVAGPDTPLTAWLRTVLWGAFLVPVLAFVLLAWWGYARAEREAEAIVAHACELAWGQARRTFEVTADIARRADRATAGPADEVRRREAEVHGRLADMTSGLTPVVNLNIWDALGRPIARSDLFPVDPSFDISDRKYFQDQRARAEPLGISDPIIGRLSGRPLFNATMRRQSSGEAFDGVIALSLDPVVFHDYYAALGSEQHGLDSLVLARLDGTVLARWPRSAEPLSKIPPGPTVVSRIAAGETAGTMTVPAAHGREARIVSFRRVGDVPVVVIARVSRDTMFASWRRFVALAAGILLPTAGGLFYVSWVALRKTQREAATARALQAQIDLRATAERSLFQTQKLETLAVVTAGVAHDFNNLLAIVTASLHIVQRRHAGLAQEKHVQAMSRAVQTGVRLTRQLLSFTRKQALRPETLRLQTWLPANEALFQSTLGSSIAWQLSVAPETLPVTVDAGELELALINLVVNARHAMPDGGALTLEVGNAVAPGAARVELAVRDRGVGVPAHLLDKVVEPFFTTREKGSGSGLGLTQVQNFCAAAGGELRLESAVGEGTTVMIFLPAADVPAPAEALPLMVPRRLRGRVLLVDDNEDVGATTETVLRAAGLEPVRRLGADAALAHLASTVEPPDVVFSDIAMPGTLNGIDLALLLRERYPGLPVLLTTGYAEQLDEAVASGLQVLQKPVEPETLLAALGKLLARSEDGIEA